MTISNIIICTLLVYRCQLCHTVCRSMFRLQQKKMVQLLTTVGFTLMIAAVFAVPANAAVKKYSHSSFCSPPHSPVYGGYYGRSYYPLGSSVTYYCESGYRLYGSPNSFCRYDRYRGHYWSHNAPVCRRKYMQILHSALAFK